MIDGTMSLDNPLDNWRFLLGKWRGESKDKYGGKGVIVTIAAFTEQPSDKFIMGMLEATKEGQLENRSTSMMFYDQEQGKFLRKSFFSYGWVNNEVEFHSSENEIRFGVVIQPPPKSFEGMRWRSFIKKFSGTRVILGLEVAKGDDEFKEFGATEFVKTV